MKKLFIFCFCGLYVFVSLAQVRIATDTLYRSELVEVERLDTLGVKGEGETVGSQWDIYR